MSNIIRDSIKKSLQNEEISKKNISVTLDESLLDDVKLILCKFNEINEGKIFTRNALIEEALKCYVKEAKEILRTDYNYDLELDTSINDFNSEFDTVIFSAHETGFKEVFINEKCWYSVKIHESRIDKIKYLAIYRTAPISAITHLVKVSHIEQFEDTDKKIIYFAENPIELPNPIVIGDYKPLSMRSARYTTKEKLLNAKEVKDLF